MESYLGKTHFLTSVCIGPRTKTQQGSMFLWKRLLCIICHVQVSHLWHGARLNKGGYQLDRAHRLSGMCPFSSARCSQLYYKVIKPKLYKGDVTHESIVSTGWQYAEGALPLSGGWEHPVKYHETAAASVILFVILWLPPFRGWKRPLIEHRIIYPACKSWITPL